MSKIFYDKYLNLKKVEKEIKKISSTYDERHELWLLVDEIIHRKIIGMYLERLPDNLHKEFLEKLEKSPHDENLFVYLTEKIKEDAENFLKFEIVKMEMELINWFKGRENGPQEKRKK